MIKENVLKIKERVSQETVGWEEGQFPPSAEHRGSFWHHRVNGFGSIRIIDMTNI